jgi:hypothetical protein
VRTGHAPARPPAADREIGRLAAIVAALVVLAVAAAGTGVFRAFHDGSVEAGSEWTRAGLGALAGLVVGGAVVLSLRSAGLASRLVAGAGTAAAVALVLATTVAVGATAGVATVHIGPIHRSPPGITPAETRTPVSLPNLDPIKLGKGGGLPGWLTAILAAIALIVAAFGAFQLARGFRLPHLRLFGRFKWRGATAGEAVDDTVDVDLAADSFDESAAMIGEGLDPRQAIIAAYARLLERLGEAGCPRLPYEAPEEHLRRSLTALGVAQDAMETVVAKFLVARFSTHPLTEVDRDQVRDALREAGRQLRELIAARAAEAAQAELAASSAADTSPASRRGG